MPVPSPGLPDPTRPQRPAAGRTSVDDRAARIRFRRALSLMVMTLVAPGSAQIAAGNARVGRIALRIWLGSWALALLVLMAVVVDHGLAISLAVSPSLLLLLRMAMLAGAVGWAVLFMDAWRLGQPLTLGMAHRRAVVGVNGLLCFSVAGTLLFGAHVLAVQRDFIVTMFGNGTATSANHGRYNVLLVGGDSGAGRWGLRPDSMTVASIDEVTGRTVLVSVPRNMKNFTFAPGSVMAKQFPDGFDADYVNGVSTWALDHTDLFPGDKDPGMDATISAVEGITGLEINYWAMVNLQGFKDLVDAVGGVTLNVRQPIPVGLPGDYGYHFIQPGTRKLDGVDTLWYARARHTSDDYSRMARQKCVMNAMLQQISPQVAVTRFEQIAKASSELISTDLPASELSTFMSLALKAKSQKISTISLVPPMVNTADPDMDQLHSMVAKAVDSSEATPSSAPKNKVRKKAEETVTGGSLGSLSTGYAANKSSDLSTAC
ncbi:LCP family protein [Nocardioides acrostichi]|uniref:LCP family protein n=1 Tax=Nocardioides acrostichi TaxID=2784339 RepID=A0A930V265_9ACTN|nr:LCP family protein [Nocardioides acrostichi]MBF4161839.1 LCP family protein [Nocardioides acrostichi]